MTHRLQSGKQTPDTKSQKRISEVTVGGANSGGGRGGAAHAHRGISADVPGFPLTVTLPFNPVRWPTGARRWG